MSRMARGASYAVSGVGEFEHFSTVKSLWEYGDQRNIRYVFLPSPDVANIIFRDAEVGKQMVAYVRGNRTTINGKVPTIKLLEGEAEEAHLNGVEKEFTDRQAGRGGRGADGGGRGGRGGRGGMPRGASYAVSGVGQFDHFSTVKSLWEFGYQSNIRYVFLPSPDVANVIFEDAEVGKQMVADAQYNGTSINGKVPIIEILEGEAEETHLASVENELADRAARYHGGRGGRGTDHGGRGSYGGRGGGRGGRGGRGW